MTQQRWAVRGRGVMSEGMYAQGRGAPRHPGAAISHVGVPSLAQGPPEDGPCKVR